jgi:hypothetical protein
MIAMDCYPFSMVAVGKANDSASARVVWPRMDMIILAVAPASASRRPIAEACEHTKIDPPADFHCLRHTWASHAVMNGVPLLVVAKNLGHSDTRMVEKHYRHLAPSYIADAIRTGAPRFGFKPEKKITTFETKVAR